VKERRRVGEAVRGRASKAVCASERRRRCVQKQSDKEATKTEMRKREGTIRERKERALNY